MLVLLGSGDGGLWLRGASPDLAMLEGGVLQLKRDLEFSYDFER
jgi:hypothetical protein